jgi:hypothetical protein
MKKILLIIFSFFSLCNVGLSTVASTTHSVSYSCTGTTGPFTFSFPIYESTDLTVVESLSGSDITITSYTVAPVNNDYMNGGSITLGTACTWGYTITISRDTNLTQEQEFTDGMPALYSTFESSLDKLTMIVQEMNDTLSLVPALPTPEAGKLLGWNSGGTALENVSANVTGPQGPTGATGPPGGNLGLANVYAIENFTDLPTAISTIGSSVASLIVDTPQSIGSSNLTIPSTLTLIVKNAGVITIPTGKALTVGPHEIDDYQAFNCQGTGYVVFTGNVPTIKSVWFGE